MKRAHGWVQAEPSQYLVHYRRGRIVHEGLGIGVWRLPGVDRVALVPVSANSLSFQVDQITQENQGVELAGFAVWRVADPRVTLQRFPFDAGGDAVATIGGDLRDVVESAIRHCVANMTIEDVLRKRATIILELKRELGYITTQWGLEIDTIEIKSVKIQSTQVFNHLQARYRDQLRLASETSAIAAEREIAVRRAEQQEELAQREAASRLREAERAQQARKRQAELDREAAVHASEQTLEREAAEARAALDLHRLKQAARAEADAAEQAAVAARRALETVRGQLAAEGKARERALAAVDAEIEAAAVGADNARRADLELIRALPGIARDATIGPISLTPDLAESLAALARRLWTPAEAGHERE